MIFLYNKMKKKMSCLLLGWGARGRSRERDISFSTVGRLTDSTIWFNCEFPCLWQYSACSRERECTQRERNEMGEDEWQCRFGGGLSLSPSHPQPARTTPHRTIALDLRWKTGDIYCCFIVTSRSCPYDARWHHHSLLFFLYLCSNDCQASASYCRESSVYFSSFSLFFFIFMRVPFIISFLFFAVLDCCCFSFSSIVTASHEQEQQ